MNKLEEVESSKSGKLLNAERINNGLVTIKSLPGHEDVNCFGGMECIPKDVLISIGTGGLEGEACDLASVPANSTASPVQHA